MAKGKAYWKKKCDKLWREKIMARFGGRCAICGATGYLNAHHLITRAAVFFRHNLENGVALCPTCHNFGFDQDVEDRDQDVISAHATPWAFEEWMEKNRPEQYEWWTKNRYAVTVGVTIDYEQVYHALEAAWH